MFQSAQPGRPPPGRIPHFVDIDVGSPLKMKRRIMPPVLKHHRRTYASACSAAFPTVKALSVVALIILVVGCLNFATLLTVRSPRFRRRFRGVSLTLLLARHSSCSQFLLNCHTFTED